MTERDGYNVERDDYEIEPALVYPQDESEFTSGEQMFANRLRKNLKALNKWVKREERSGYPIGAYRIYDADMPEYSVAVDHYNDSLYVAEYQAPASIEPEAAQRRLNEIKRVLPLVCGVSVDDIHYKQRQRQRGQWQYEKRAGESVELVVEEGPAKLKVNLSDYLDTGLFLDHRPLRRRIATEIQGKRFLNLFCYTASVTVQAALGGCTESVSVDMSKVYLDWARQNFELNHLDAGKHQLVAADCTQWLQSCNERFDTILLDPPSFSNSKRMDDVLDIQRDHGELIRACCQLLKPGGLLYFSNNFKRFKLDADLREEFLVEDISPQTLDMDFKRNPKIHRCWLIKNR